MGRKEQLLRRQLEENNRKSPDIPAVILTATTVHHAVRAAEIFEDITGEDLPVQFKEWWKTIKLPVDLYFDFTTERMKNKFLKRVYKELGITRDERNE